MSGRGRVRGRGPDGGRRAEESATCSAPILLVPQASSRDTLSLRAERVVPTVTARFTPLEPLPALNTSLWARILEQGPHTEGKGKTVPLDVAVS